MFEKGPYGRDKICGDGLTPRAIAALNKLNIDHSNAHRIDGLRMIAGKRERELLWPSSTRFPNHGAVWPRGRFDSHLVDGAICSGADVRFGAEALPYIENNRCSGVIVNGEKFTSPLTVLATGAQGQAASILGAVRDTREPYGLAIRGYAPTSRHAERYLEACLSLCDENGTAIAGYGWVFPAGDGTVNVGVGALSTMKGFTTLNLNKLLSQYSTSIRDLWDLGKFVEKPRAWRLPMSCIKRHGLGWAAVGDAAGFVNPMNGEGIDYGLESGVLVIEKFFENPETAPFAYDVEIGERFDSFLRTGRRFSFLIGHPWLLKPGLRVAVGTQQAAEVTLAVMGNLIDSSTPGLNGKVMRVADASLRAIDPLLRLSRRKV